MPVQTLHLKNSIHEWNYFTKRLRQFLLYITIQKKIKIVIYHDDDHLAWTSNMENYEMNEKAKKKVK